MQELEEVEQSPTSATPMVVVHRDDIPTTPLMRFPSRRSIKEVFITSIKLAGPMMMVSVVVTGSSFTSAFIMSYLGTEVYQATSLMTLMEWTMPVFANLAAVATIAAQYNLNRGPDENQEHHFVVGPSMRTSHVGPVVMGARLSDLGRIYQAGFTIASVASVPLGAIFAFAENILVKCQQPANLAKLAGDFSRYYIVGIPGYLLTNVNIQMANALGFQWSVLISQSMGAVIGNVVGALLTNFTDLGVKGMALGIAAQYWTSFAFLTSFYLYKSITDPNIRDAELFRLHGRTIWPFIKKSLSLGVLIALFFATEVSAMLMDLLMTGWMGSDELAAIITAFQYLFLGIIPIYALSEATNIEVAKNFAQGRFDDVRRFGNVNIVTGVIYGAGALTVLVAIPELLTRVFVEQDATTIIALSVATLRLTAPRFVVDALRIIPGGAVRGLEDVIMTAITSIVGLWLAGALPCAIAVKYAGMNLNGLSWVSNGGIALACIPQVVWWLYKSHKIDDQSTWLTRIMDKLFGCCRRPRVKPEVASTSRFALFADENPDKVVNESLKLKPKPKTKLLSINDDAEPVYAETSRCGIM